MSNRQQISFYQQQLEGHTSNLKLEKLAYRKFSLLRLLFFVFIVAGCYFLWTSYLLVPIVALFVGVFVYFVHKSLDAKLKKEKTEFLIELNKNELLAQAGDWSNFPNGAEYKSSNHPFAMDMDIFGEKSVFQLLNRTALTAGSRKLASVLQYGTKNTKLYNEAINDFSADIEWCQAFYVEGKVRIQSTTQQRSITQLTTTVFPSKIIYFLKWVLPFISIVTVGLNTFDVIPNSIMIGILLSVLLVIFYFFKASNKAMYPVQNIENEVNAIIFQLHLLKKLQPSSELTRTFIAELIAENGVEQELKKLALIQKRMSYRANFLVSVVLNLFAAWDFLVIHELHKWLDKNASQLATWEDQLAELEVWVSGAIFKFNHPNSVFAQFSEHDELQIDELGHPFVAAEKQVRNAIQLSTKEHFLIITGPNMAGKSTYLRSVGLAIISANAGFPILAKNCVLPHYELYSSMRTTDDLTVESSYFHAELTRLRFIMDAIESGKKTFIILDEILKGTNSHDKEIGSAKFLQKLHRLGAKGIIATHDLSLTKLSEGTEVFRNVYFDSTIHENELSFDYKVSDGVCQNMNASFLLKQMKLVD